MALEGGSEFEKFFRKIVALYGLRKRLKQKRIYIVCFISEPKLDFSSKMVLCERVGT